jgi:hypothetical protein
VTRKKFRVELTAKEAEAVLDALALRSTMFESGDMEGMYPPREVVAKAAATTRARTAVYESGFKW